MLTLPLRNGIVYSSPKDRALPPKQMTASTPKHVFALTLKRWFKSNGWPQAITDTWAKDPGTEAPSGPWASQICGAMKGDFHPRVEFFLAMARFNQYVADQDLKSITASKLRDRLKGARPLINDDGKLFGATDFFGLFTGLMLPPLEFAHSDEPVQESPEDDQLWEISLDHLSNQQLMELVKQRLHEAD